MLIEWRLQVRANETPEVYSTPPQPPLPLARMLCSNRVCISDTAAILRLMTAGVTGSTQVQPSTSMGSHTYVLHAL